MKSILAIVLFTAASLQANDLAESWRSFGKQYRTASFAKAVVVTALAIEAGRAFLDHGKKMFEVAGNTKKWSQKWQEFAREMVICGSTGGTGFALSYYFLPEHLKHAFAVS